MEFINNLILLLSGQGIVLAIFVFLKDKTPRNRWIGLYLFIFSGILIFWYFAYWSPDINMKLRIFRGDLFLHLFLGPSLLMALNTAAKWKKHFLLPTVIGLLFWAFWIFLYNYLTINKSWEGLGFDYGIYFYLNIASLTLICWYLIQTRPYFDSKPNKLIILALGAYLLGWIGSHTMFLAGGYIAAIDYTLVFLEIFFFYGTGYYVLIGGRKKPGYQVDQTELSLILSKISKLMDEQQPYLDAGFSVRQMSEQLDIHPKKLSQTINQGFGQSFTEYINSHRIGQAKELLVSESHHQHTVLEILMECGFNSKSAFNVAFKKHTGLSPLEFKKAAIRAN